MYLEVDYKTYVDFEDFRRQRPRLAKQLVDIVGEDYWMEDYIFVYESVAEYAKYEVTEGWYYNILGGFEDRLSGLANILNYVNFSRFGDDLVKTLDESKCCIVGTKVIVSAAGF